MASLAELLRELKERSGLSYGALAKRLHMSTSTVHRYCNGDAVPTDFAPVERFARLCEATPKELVEVHRRWILADADRGRKAEAPAGGAPEPEPKPQPEPKSSSKPQPEPEPQPKPLHETEHQPEREHRPKGEHRPEAEHRPEPETLSVPGPVTASSPLSLSRKRRTLILAAAVTAVLGIGSVALSMNGGGDGDHHRQSAGPTASSDPNASLSDPSGKKSGKHKPGSKDENGASSGPPSKDGNPAPGASRDGGKGSASGAGQGEDTGVPLTARTEPYAYEDDCTHTFLVNRKPDEVPEPPGEQDAPGWVGDLGAVTSGSQYIEVTVQGLGKDTVVLQDMNVRVQSSDEPLAWNNFQMGTGCGGRVSTKSFAVDLDSAAPRTTPKSGQRDFPYKVSENDPEVFHVLADVKRHDVRWYLELEWSSGKRHGVLRVDDQGKPFRTSSREGRPLYGWWRPGWEKEGAQGG